MEIYTAIRVLEQSLTVLPEQSTFTIFYAAVIARETLIFRVKWRRTRVTKEVWRQIAIDEIDEMHVCVGADLVMLWCGSRRQMRPVDVAVLCLEVF